MPDKRPDLRAVPAGPGEPGAAPRDLPAFRESVRRLRHAYQRGLLGWLRSEEPEAGLETMRTVLAELGRLAGEAPLGRLWRAAVEVVDALREQALEPGVSAAYLLAGLDRRIKTLAEEGPAALDRPPPAELLETLRACVERGRAGSQPAPAGGLEAGAAAGLPPEAEERLAGLAEELDAGNARTAEQVRAFREGLSELETTLARLRERVRRLEGECDASATAPGGGRTADPASRLATRLEEASALARGLEPALADALRLGRRLEGPAREAEASLEQQARTGRSLRQALARLRGDLTGTAQALVLDLGSETLAVPLEGVEAVVKLDAPARERLRAQRAPVYEHAGRCYRWLALDHPAGGEAPGGGHRPAPAPHAPAQTPRGRTPVVLVRAGGSRLALPADRVTGPLELTVQPLDVPLGALPAVSGGAILGAGRVALVLDLDALEAMEAPAERPDD